jgi:hypothetical protein
MRAEVIAVEGPSAAGKTRAVRDVAPGLGAAPLAEAYERLRPRPPLGWRTPGELLRTERRLLQEEARRYREARELSQVGGLVVADTGFLGPLTYASSVAAMGLVSASRVVGLVEEARGLARAGRWGLPDALVYLRTSPAVRRRRAARDPRGHPASLQRRHQEVGEVEFRFYRSTLARSFGPRFRFVSGDGPPELVAGRVRRAVGRLLAVRSPPPPVDPILDALEAAATVP